ncbi:unnamed protein product, partial [Urochloa humidicola]
VWSRGPTTLPDRPIPLESRPIIRPKGKRAWKVDSPGSHKRLVNNILGRLCRDHFPGVVLHSGVYEPAFTFHHYVVAPDQADRDGRIFPNKAQRVIGEL